MGNWIQLTMKTTLEKIAVPGQVEAGRRFVGLRMEKELYRRIDAVAKKQKTSARAVIEQLSERGLPAMETALGIMTADAKHQSVKGPQAVLLDEELRETQHAAGRGSLPGQGTPRKAATQRRGAPIQGRSRKAASGS